MREIKFRAWDKSDKEMYSNIQKGIKFTDLSHYTFDEFLGNPKGMGDYHKWVVMQYTGLKDKNGVEIYEGDILSARANRFSKEDIQSVEFKDGCFDIGWSLKYVEVIGNIYENKELLIKERKV